jgi:hypothetical protein
MRADFSQSGTGMGAVRNGDKAGKTKKGGIKREGKGNTRLGRQVPMFAIDIREVRVRRFKIR